MITTLSEDISKLTPREYRLLVRKGGWPRANREVCPTFAHTSLVAIPRDWAFEFLLFAQRNPSLGQVLDVTEPGGVTPLLIAPDADVRTDLPRYRVYKDGELVAEPFKAVDHWRADLVAFLLGCSRGLDAAFVRAELNYRLIGIFDSTLPLVPAGRLHGQMAVSCRAFPTNRDAMRAIQESSRQTAFHGGPVHMGDPAKIGIKDISKPDYPLPYPMAPLDKDEIPLFWGCAVTPQKVAIECKVPYMIVSYEGHLLVTDRPSLDFQSV